MLSSLYRWLRPQAGRRGYLFVEYGLIIAAAVAMAFYLFDKNGSVIGKMVGVKKDGLLDRTAAVLVWINGCLDNVLNLQ